MLISTNSGLHSGRPGKERYPMVQAIDFFADAGFEAVDLNFCAITYREQKHEPILDGDWRANLDRVMERVRARGLVVSHSHVPFFDYADVAHPDYDMRCQGIRHAIEAAAYCGAPWTVIHCAKGRENSEEMITETVEALKPYRDVAEKFGIGLAVENNFHTTAEILLEMIARLDSPLVGACWDIGHANKEPYVDPAEGILTLGKTLKVTHLHDNYGTKDNHNVPYFGVMDWDAVTRALVQSGYEGTFNYEVNVARVCEAARMDLAKYLVSVARDLLERNGGR